MRRSRLMYGNVSLTSLVDWLRDVLAPMLRVSRHLLLRQIRREAAGDEIFCGVGIVSRVREQPFPSEFTCVPLSCSDQATLQSIPSVIRQDTSSREVSGAGNAFA